MRYDIRVRTLVSLFDGGVNMTAEDADAGKENVMEWCRSSFAGFRRFNIVYEHPLGTLPPFSTLPRNSFPALRELHVCNVRVPFEASALLPQVRRISLWSFFLLRRQLRQF